MYHVNKNKKSIKSANTIINTYIKIAQNKNIENISISELCNKSYISRTTFYRLFDKVEDIIPYKIDLIFNEIINNSTYNFKDGFNNTVKILINNSDFMDIIYKNRKLDEVFSCYKKYRNKFIELISIKYNNPDLKVADSLLYYFLFGIHYRDELGITNNPDSLYEIYKNTILYFKDIVD